MSLVDGIVNVYNGKLIQKNVDVQIGGSKPFEINRYYDSGHHFTGKLGYGIGLSTPLLVTFERKEKKRNLRFEQRSGFEIVCTVKKVSGKKKTAYYKGSVDQDFFKNGYTNCCEALLNGEPSLQSLKVEGNRDQFNIKLGNGTIRVYQYFATNHNSLLYRLIREDFADSTHRHYSYKEERSLSLKRIWTTNSDQSLTLNWVDFKHGSSYVDLTTSNGLYVCYHQKLTEGEIRRTKSIFRDSVDHYENILEKVTSNFLPECNYIHSTHARDVGTLFTLREVKLSNQFVRADFNKRKRVKRIWKSGVRAPFYTFKYHDHYTTVTDANGREKHFHYEKKRLVATVETDHTKRFRWDEKGQLIKQTLTDDKNNLIEEKTFTYDRIGNVVESKTKGNICQKGSTDEHVTRYTYGPSCNRLFSENYNHTKEITYSYTIS